MNLEKFCKTPQDLGELLKYMQDKRDFTTYMHVSFEDGNLDEGCLKSDLDNAGKNPNCGFEMYCIALGMTELFLSKDEDFRQQAYEYANSNV